MDPVFPLFKIERMPLRTSPSDRLNAYHRHALAPWIKATGYFTPLYIFRRDQERIPFHMDQWLTEKVSDHMLHAPARVLNLDQQHVARLLTLAYRWENVELAYRCQNSTDFAQEHANEIRELANEISELASLFPALEASESGYFIRLSESSPKDVDNGNLLPVKSIAAAFEKLIRSKRAVQALLALHYASSEIGNKLYFFPYHTDLDHLSEWRCFVHRGHIVAISQSRFYHPHHSGVTDAALKRLALQIDKLWRDISPELSFTSCALDVYAEIHRRDDTRVKLIEINPYYAYSGTESFLFHWLDDADILLSDTSGMVIRIRLVDSESGNGELLSRKEAYEIGRANIIPEELAVLKRRELQWILKPEHHARFKKLALPGGRAGMVATWEAGLERYSGKVSGSSDAGAVDHARFRELQEAYLLDRQQNDTQEMNRERAYTC